MPHIQRCNWIANNLTGQGMQCNAADGLFTKSSKLPKESLLRCRLKKKAILKGKDENLYGF